MFATINLSTLTKVRAESNDDPQPWQPRHWTGSARTEGFYKISSRDKVKYLNNTKLTVALSSSNKVSKRISLSDLFYPFLNVANLFSIVYFSRECASRCSSRPSCGPDQISGLNSVACCLRLTVTATWSNLTSWRWVDAISQYSHTI